MEEFSQLRFQQMRMLLSLRGLSCDISQAAARIVFREAQANGSPEYLIDPSATLFRHVVCVSGFDGCLEFRTVGSGDFVERFVSQCREYVFIEVGTDFVQR
ncbi:hypothetical protein D3C73_1067170 [compost metagenome]